MANTKSPFKPLVAVLATGALLASASPGAMAADISGSDYHFNEMVMELAGRDTGSMWFDYYVEGVNQQIAAKSIEEPYGAAGPSGPLTGFDGYLAGFTNPDTGSMWFNSYVDRVNQVLKDKGY
jgi:hypothetical protein